MLISGLALGAVLGFVMQRGRFCVTGFLRDIFTQRSWRGFVALLIVISVHAIGLAALTSAGVINTRNWHRWLSLLVALSSDWVSSWPVAAPRVPGTAPVRA